MNIKCRETRKNRIVKSIQNKLDLSRRNKFIPRCQFCHGRLDGITTVSVSFIDDKLDMFISFLNKDPKRMKDLNKSKYLFLKETVKNSISKKETRCLKY